MTSQLSSPWDSRAVQQLLRDVAHSKPACTSRHHMSTQRPTAVECWPHGSNGWRPDAGCSVSGSSRGHNQAPRPHIATLSQPRNATDALRHTHAVQNPTFCSCWRGEASPTDRALPAYQPTYTIHDSEKTHKDILAVLAAPQSQDQLAQVVVESQPCTAQLQQQLCGKPYFHPEAMYVIQGSSGLQAQSKHGGD